MRRFDSIPWPSPAAELVCCELICRTASIPESVEQFDVQNQSPGTASERSIVSPERKEKS
jgi:hypothetical protein